MSSNTNSISKTGGSESDGEKEEQFPSKRRNLGRQARRRRKKVMEIEAAAASANGQKSVSTILPTDRDYVWPAVKELCELKVADEVLLKSQLGYLPGNALSVGARVNEVLPALKDDSSPLVVKLYPLVLRDESDGTKNRRKRKRQKAQSTEEDNDKRKDPLMEPFPTIYWVTEPKIKALISKLELDQWGKKMEQRLEDDAEAMESMHQAHKLYGQERRSTITAKDWEWIQQRRWEAVFAETRGVAGIRNPKSIKCLHAHAAHYWSGCKSNIVGKWVSDEVQMLLQREKTVAE